MATTPNEQLVRAAATQTWGAEAAEALMMMLGSEHAEARFDRLDRRLDQIDTRLDQMERRLDQVDTRLDRFELKFEKIDAEFQRLDAKIDWQFARMVYANLMMAIGTAGLVLAAVSIGG